MKRSSSAKHNIKCPECGSDHVISNGDYWTCASCGRKWRKIYRRNVLYHNVKLEDLVPVDLMIEG